jgi:hypothetical protein
VVVFMTKQVVYGLFYFELLYFELLYFGLMGEHSEKMSRKGCGRDGANIPFKGSMGWTLAHHFTIHCPSFTQHYDSKFIRHGECVLYENDIRCDQ